MPHFGVSTKSGELQFVVATIAIALAFLRYGSWESEPVRVELPSHTAVVRAFEVNLAGPYEVVLVLDRISGVVTPWNSRKDRWRPVNLTWSVNAADRQVATGNSADFHWNHIGGAGFEGQTLGTFAAEAGVLYDLVVSVNSEDPRVRLFNPRICVWSDNSREPFHSRYFFFPALFGLGVMMVISGTVLLAVPAAWGWLKQRSRHAA